MADANPAQERLLETIWTATQAVDQSVSAATVAAFQNRDMQQAGALAATAAQSAAAVKDLTIALSTLRESFAELKTPV